MFGFVVVVIDTQSSSLPQRRVVDRNTQSHEKSAEKSPYHESANSS